MSVKRLEITCSLGRWALVHNGQALGTYATEAEAEQAAEAIARHQPSGDEVEVVVSEDEVDEGAAAA